MRRSPSLPQSLRLPFTADYLCLCVHRSRGADRPSWNAAVFLKSTHAVAFACRRSTRTALEAGAQQARGALLRSGWTRARLSNNWSKPRSVRRALTCVQRSAESKPPPRKRKPVSRRGRAPTAMTFPGAERTLDLPAATLTRWAGVLRQDIDAHQAPCSAVREREGVQRLTLMMPPHLRPTRSRRMRRANPGTRPDPSGR